MDNGLIFPYRRANARANVRDAKDGRLLLAFGLVGVDSPIRTCGGKLRRDAGR